MLHNARLTRNLFQGSVAPLAMFSYAPLFHPGCHRFHLGHRDRHVRVEAAVPGGDAAVFHHAGDREDPLGMDGLSSSRSISTKKISALTSTLP